VYEETVMAGEQLPSVSPAETEILRLVWGLGNATVKDVCDKLPPTRRITYATVQTLLRRLEGKGYLTHDVKGKAHVFRPAVEPGDVIKRTVGDFVDRLFGGDPVSLMLHLAGHAELDADDIKRLRELIDKDSGQLPRGRNDGIHSN
jgi:BlaI family penicillinase repressor